MSGYQLLLLLYKTFHSPYIVIDTFNTHQGSVLEIPSGTLFPHRGRQIFIYGYILM